MIMGENWLNDVQLVTLIPHSRDVFKYKYAKVKSANNVYFCYIVYDPLKKVYIIF